MKASPIAVPRLASTVLLLASSRDLGQRPTSPLLSRTSMKANDINVLMVRRHNRARFMPEMYVFPGGGVEQEDERVVAEMGFVSKAVLPQSPESQQKQLHEAWRCRVAALRELSEETSCVLRADDTIESLEDWKSSGPERADHVPFDATAAPNLTPIGHWITPEDNKYRYDTYFYGVALRGPGAGEDRLPPQLVKLQNQESEISSLIWVSPLEALIRHETPTEAFALPPPTFHLLSALARMPSFATLADQWHQRRMRLSPGTPPEEMTFQAVTPGSRSTNGGKDVEFFQIPEHFFHNIGPDGALKAGRYSMPTGSATKDGKANYVDLFVGERLDNAPAKRISFLKD